MESRRRKHIQSKQADPKRGRYHHGDLRRALLEATVELISKGREEGLSLREVARQAGVTHAAPYRHFESKEALLAAASEEGFRLLKVAIEEATAKTKPGVSRLRTAFEGYVRFATENPVHFRVMFRYLAGETPEHEALHEAAKEAFGKLVEVVGSGQGTGQIREGNPLDFSLAAWAMVHGTAMLLIDQSLPPELQRSIPELAELMTGALVKGLGKH